MAKVKRCEIFLVDDHPIVRQGLTRLINGEKDLTVCGEAESAEQAMTALETQQPDLAIVDLSLKGLSGLTLIKEIKTRFPQVSILVVSMHGEAFYAERVLRLGAKGYVMKQEAPDTILKAIRLVLRGELYVSEPLAKRLLRTVVAGEPGDRADESPLQRLSDRELEVFGLIGRGLGTRQIAEQLYLSVKTVESYREHIKDKLQLENATELLQQAIQWTQQAG